MRYKDEQSLYEAIRDSLIPDLLNYKSNFSRYDCFSDDFNMQIELKCRTRHYDELLIEHIKYEYMIQE